MTESPQTIDAYLDTINPDFRPHLEHIRNLVKELVPSVVESISYRMPTLSYRGRALVYFTASKKHMSFYPSSFALEELAGRLAEFKKTAHAVQFTADRPLPDDLIRDLVLAHQRHIDADEDTASG